MNTRSQTGSPDAVAPCRNLPGPTPGCAGPVLAGFRAAPPRSRWRVAVPALLMTGLLAVPVAAQTDGTDRELHGLELDVGRYLALKARADADDELAGVLLGAYVAGLFAGIGHANARTPQPLYCPPANLDPALREVLHFLDEALQPGDGGQAAQQQRALRDVLLDALIERFPCR